MDAGGGAVRSLAGEPCAVRRGVGFVQLSRDASAKREAAGGARGAERPVDDDHDRGHTVPRGALPSPYLCPLSTAKVYAQLRTIPRRSQLLVRL